MTAELARALGPRRWLRCRPRTCRARSSPKSNTSRLRGRDETAVDVVLGNRAKTLTLGVQVITANPQFTQEETKAQPHLGARSPSLLPPLPS